MPVFLQRVGSDGVLQAQRIALDFGPDFVVTDHPTDTLAGSPDGPGQVTGYLRIDLAGSPANEGGSPTFVDVTVTSLEVTGPDGSFLCDNSAEIDGDLTLGGALNMGSGTATVGEVDANLLKVGEWATFAGFAGIVTAPGAGGGALYMQGGNLHIKLPDNTTRTLASATPPTVTGSRGGNAALASLLTTLASLGYITDGSS